MILRWLLNHLMFAGTTFFAAGAGALGGGGAAAGSPGATGGGSGATEGAGGGKAIGDTSGGTQGAEGTQAGAEGTEAALGDPGADDFGSFEDFGDDDAAAYLQDREEFGPETYKSLKEALKASPELFKQTKKAISLVKRFTEHFETPEAAGELIGDLQTHGGWEGIKQELGETATFLNGWNAGDADVVTSWIKENGDGLAKNMPVIMREWQTRDEQGWAHDAAQTFIATLNQAPVGGISALAALGQLGQIEGVKDSEAYKTIVDAIKNVQKIANTAPAKAEAKPDTSKLTEREKNIQQQERSLRTQQLGGKANPILQSAAQNALKLVAGSRKLGPQAQKDLISDIHSEFARLMEKDTDGKSKRQRLIEAGQSDQWLKMVKSAADRTMPLAARRVWRKYAGISGLTQQEKQTRQSEGRSRSEVGSTGGTQGLQTKSPGDGRQVDREAMLRKFGGRDKADDAFLFGSKEHGGKRVWIERGTGTIYTY